jgi:ketosteroid isomerase-like protein
MKIFVCSFFAIALLADSGLPALAADGDKAAVAALDTEYQAAVKNNDAAVMGRILADDFVLVTGKGKTYSKADLLRAAKDRTETYEHQEDTRQTVRVWGDTAVVTALLWIKGKNKDAAYDYKLWFSDTYARTPQGWRYVFGQASTKLAPEDLTPG